MVSIPSVHSASSGILSAELALRGATRHLFAERPPAYMNISFVRKNAIGCSTFLWIAYCASSRMKLLTVYALCYRRCIAREYVDCYRCHWRFFLLWEGSKQFKLYFPQGEFLARGFLEASGAIRGQLNAGKVYISAAKVVWRRQFQPMKIRLQSHLKLPKPSRCPTAEISSLGFGP